MNANDSTMVAGPEDAFAALQGDDVLLQAVLDTLVEGVLVVDAEGGILITNQRFHELWQVPGELQQAGDDAALLSHITAQLQDASAFLEDMQRLHGSEADSLDWLQCTDGRIFERVGRPVPGQGGGRLWFFRDVTEQKQLENTLSDMAYHDALTGLPNRKLLADRLEQAMAHAVRAETCVAVCYADLDGFKRVNDQYGHACGDALLMEISRRFTNALRADDTVARTGGDEFIMVLNSLSGVEEAVPVLERVLHVTQEPFALSDTVSVRVTVSMGVALFPQDGNNASHLILQADSAMYHAKLGGRSCYRFF